MCYCRFWQMASMFSLTTLLMVLGVVSVIAHPRYNNGTMVTKNTGKVTETLYVHWKYVNVDVLSVSWLFAITKCLVCDPYTGGLFNHCLATHTHILFFSCNTLVLANTSCSIAFQVSYTLYIERKRNNLHTVMKVRFWEGVYNYNYIVTVFSLYGMH